MEGAVGNVSLRNKRFRLSPSRKWEGDRNRERGGGEWKKSKACILKNAVLSQIQRLIGAVWQC